MPLEKISLALQLREHLIEARASIRTADLRAAVGRGLNRAAWFSMVVLLLLLVLRRFTQVPASGASKLLTVFILASALVVFLRPVWRILLHGLSLEETAHWLDGATNAHNKIVAALELCDAGDESAFAMEALRDGVRQARRVEFFESADSRGPFGMVVPLLVITVTVAVIVATPSGAISRIAAVNSPIERAVADRAVLAELTEDPAQLKTSSDRSLVRHAQLSGENSSESVRRPGARSASGGLGGGSDSTRTALSQIQRSQLDAKARSGRSDKNSRAAQALQSSSASDPSGGAQSFPGIGSPSDDSQTTPEQQASDQNHSSDAQTPGFNQEAEKQPGESSGSAPPASETQKQSAANLPASQKPDSPENTPSSATPVHKPASGSDKANNRGQDTGIDAPKKSRGVAPLLLETRLPDLFQGRPLSGPEQRSLYSLRPEAGDVAKATQSDTEARGGDEQAVSRYEVPADLRQEVGAYFKLFEQNAEQTRADSALNKE